MVFLKVPTDLYGNMKNYNGIKTACVSLLDEHYNLTYKPFVVEWSSIVENQ